MKNDITKTEARALKAIWQDRKAKDKSLTQVKLAELCGYENPTVVNQYLNGYIPLNLTALLKFAEALHFRPSEVSKRLAEHKAIKVAEEQSAYRINAFARIPVIKWDKNSTDVKSLKSSATEYIASIQEMSTNVFAIEYQGISMSPTFEQGDKLIVDPDQSPKNGDFVAAVADGALFIRRYDEEEDLAYLVACNPHWPDKIQPITAKFKILGKIVRRVTDY